MKSRVLLFINDTKIFKQIASEEDSVMLQHDIDALNDWTKNWLLNLIEDKCHVPTIGKIKDIKHTHRYDISSKELDHVFSENDLG